LYVSHLQSEAGVKCRKFPDLNQLIQQYMLRGTKNGLAGPMLHPVAVDEPDDEPGAPSSTRFVIFEEITQVYIRIQRINNELLVFPIYLFTIMIVQIVHFTAKTTFHIYSVLY
jgi:hypothetical protein